MSNAMPEEKGAPWQDAPKVKPHKIKGPLT